VEDSRSRPNPEDIIKNRQGSEGRANFSVVAVPLFPRKRGRDREREKQRSKRNHAEGIRFGISGGHATGSFVFRWRRKKKNSSPNESSLPIAFVPEFLANHGIAGRLPAPRRNLIFLLHGLPEILQNREKSGLTGPPPRHRSGRLRSKYFKKSEKKACQPS
jgi:hypothetical protein